MSDELDEKYNLDTLGTIEETGSVESSEKPQPVKHYPLRWLVFAALTLAGLFIVRLTRGFEDTVIVALVLIAAEVFEGKK